MAQKRRLIVNESPKSLVAEAFRVLRTNIQFSKTENELKAIMFSSAGPTEGKSTIIANIAISMAQAGTRVILLDCDLRKPIQHDIFCLKNIGLTNALVENIPVASLIQQTYINNLSIVAGGPTPQNPSELLGAKKLRNIIEQLKNACDIVLLDAPPILAVTDGLVLASLTDGVILVINSGVNRPEVVLKAKELLMKVGGHILGTVLNRVEPEEHHIYHYYYYANDDKTAVRGAGF